MEQPRKDRSDWVVRKIEIGDPEFDKAPSVATLTPAERMDYVYRHSVMCLTMFDKDYGKPKPRLPRHAVVVEQRRR